MKSLKTGFCLLVIALCGFTYANAQTAQTEKVQRNYEVMMQTVIGTDAADNQNNTPSALSPEIGKLKQNYSYKNYRMSLNNFQRIAENGTINSRTLINSIGSFPSIESYPIYFNWRLVRVKNSDNETTDSVKIDFFHFDASFPAPRSNSIAYDKIELDLSELVLKIGKPTVIGSIAVPQTNETLFFITTVKEIKN